MFTIQRTIHIIKGDSSNCIFFNYAPFWLRLFWHFVISLLLLKMFTWKSEYVFTIQRAIGTVKGDNSKCFFFFWEFGPFFDLDFLSSITHPTAERWHPRAVLLCVFFFCCCFFSSLNLILNILKRVRPPGVNLVSVTTLSLLLTTQETYTPVPLGRDLRRSVRSNTAR